MINNKFVLELATGVLIGAFLLVCLCLARTLFIIIRGAIMSARRRREDKAAARENLKELIQAIEKKTPDIKTAKQRAELLHWYLN
jgi:hypothetical protein